VETDNVRATIQRMKDNGVSQVPVVDAHHVPKGIVHEVDILRGLQSGKIGPQSTISEISHAISGLVIPQARVEELYPILESDRVAIVVDGGKVKGLIAKIDIIEYMSNKMLR
jgi:cystathionine beta-synthase